MKNPFISHSNATPKLKRNAYDLSFQNNLSLPMGYEIPVFVKEGLPGDSFRIKAGAYLRAWPTVFPVQTPVRMTMHFFQVYNRTLWKNWQDFIYGNKTDLVHPYLNPSTLSSRGRVGSIYDYMGVPISFYSSKERKDSFNTYDRSNGHMYVVSPATSIADLPSFPDDSIRNANDPMDTAYPAVLCIDDNISFKLGFVNSMNFMQAAINRVSDIPASIRSDFPYMNENPECSFYQSVVVYRKVTIGSGLLTTTMFPVYMSKPIPHQTIWDVDIEAIKKACNESVTEFNPGRGGLAVQEDRFVFGYYIDFSNNQDLTIALTTESSGYGGLSFNPIVQYRFDYSNGISIADGATNPYNDVHINALPFRAYEAIHNSFYRDNLNDPWFIGSDPQYNNYITTHDDGEDSTPYRLFQHNWEKDFLTSAYPSPQQGAAPLVGITSTGRMQFEMPDGNIREVQGEYDDEGQLVNFDQRSLANLPADEADTLRLSAIRAVTQGISINDLRMVGGMQRWLEANIRRGYRYREQLLAHTGVKADFDELDMPVFLGGYSRIVNTAQINNTSAQGDAPLGAFGGQLSFFNSMDKAVSCFFKEHGWVIGILTITPVPAYSQLLPKHFIKENALSYFDEKFSRIGMQPILYREVCPVQIANDGDTSITLTDTFGYQRPWYDLIRSVDEVHGQMRTSMRDFIMNRTFDEIPQLNGDFLHVDPNQLNQVFAYTDGTNDSFFGLVEFNVVKKTPIPRSGIPMLNA